MPSDECSKPGCSRPRRRYHHQCDYHAEPRPHDPAAEEALTAGSGVGPDPGPVGGNDREEDRSAEAEATARIAELRADLEGRSEIRIPVAEFTDHAKIDAAATQPRSTGTGGPDIARLVQADIEARAEYGATPEKYGQRLRPFNGRDAELDAYQEALDLVMYQRQRLAEREAEYAPPIRPEDVQETDVGLDEWARASLDSIVKSVELIRMYAQNIANREPGRPPVKQAGCILRLCEDVLGPDTTGPMVEAGRTVYVEEGHRVEMSAERLEKLVSGVLAQELSHIESVRADERAAIAAAIVQLAINEKEDRA
jgi:hypothetical protein